MSKADNQPAGAENINVEAKVEHRPNAFITCIYEEFNPYSYEGVSVRIEAADESWSENRIYLSDSPMRDKYNAISAAKEKLAKIHVMSSWDNFLSDSLREIMRLSKLPRPASGGKALTGRGNHVSEVIE